MVVILWNECTSTAYCQCPEIETRLEQMRNNLLLHNRDLDVAHVLESLKYYHMLLKQLNSLKLLVLLRIHVNPISTKSTPVWSKGFVHCYGADDKPNMRDRGTVSTSKLYLCYLSITEYHQCQCIYPLPSLSHASRKVQVGLSFLAWPQLPPGRSKWR